MESLGWSAVFVVALAAPVALLLNGLVQRWRNKAASPGWLSGIMALLTILAGGALVIAATFDRLSIVVLATLFVLGMAEIIVGLAVWTLIERRLEPPQPAHSFGILTAAVGGLTAVMVLFVPLLPGQFALALLTPTPYTTRVVPPSATPTLARSATPTHSPTATPTLTLTPEPSATQSATPTPTRVRYVTPTPSATPALFPVCGAVAEYNVNLRAEPTLDAAIMNVIPYQSVIDIAGRNPAGDWWFGRFEGDWGWVDGRYITLDTDCPQAPVLAD